MLNNLKGGEIPLIFLPMENLFEFENNKYNNIQYEKFCLWSSPKKDIDDDLHFFSLKNEYLYTPNWLQISQDNNKETFEKNLLDPFWSTFLRRYRIIIQKDDTKVRIKFYFYTKEKPVGKKFYRVHTHLTYFTYNYKTNSLYRGKDRKSTRLNSSHMSESRMPSSA